MRDKFMSYGEFTGVQQYEWSLVRLDLDALPGWMENIPTGIVYGVYASGNSASAIQGSGDSGFAVGGIDVIRRGTDGRAKFKKDVHRVVSGIHSSGLVVQGPSRDDEHWVNELPERYCNARTLNDQYDWDL